MNALPPELAGCRACPRLVEHRESVAHQKRRAYRSESYWGRPVPGFGDADAQLILLGLAPGAHGSNRTGRMFTGDASGDFLFPALYRAGLASGPQAERADDGLTLSGVWITASARCVPPGNRPNRSELENCRRWLDYDFRQLPRARLVVALGSIAHDSYLDLLRYRGAKPVKREHPFGHGSLHPLDNVTGVLPLLDSYHPSFQNTNTGRLTAAMFDELLARARRLAGLGQVTGDQETAADRGRGS
ncbi:MAG: uracil-DNA glycosylase [Trueperaceae bacterium]